jgi:hypothetical protein
MPIHAPTALFTNIRFSHLWLYRDQKQSLLDSCLHSARSLFFFFYRNIIAQKLGIFNKTIILIIVGSQYWTVRHTWKIIYSIGTFSVGWLLILRLIILTILILIIIQARIIPDDPYTYLIRIPSVGISNDIYRTRIDVIITFNHVSLVLGAFNKTVFLSLGNLYVLDHILIMSVYKEVSLVLNVVMLSFNLDQDHVPRVSGTYPSCPHMCLSVKEQFPLVREPTQQDHVSQ